MQNNFKNANIVNIVGNLYQLKAEQDGENVEIRVVAVPKKRGVESGLFDER